jgi:hypothetical protein
MKGLATASGTIVHGSCQDAINDRPMDIRQTAVDAIVVKRELLVIDPEQMQDRRVKVGNGHFVPGDEISDLVRLSIVKALFHASAGQKTGERRRMIIAAR